MTHILVDPNYSLKHTRARTVDDRRLTRQMHNRCKYVTESELNHIRSESRLKWLSAWEDPGKAVIKSVYDWESTYSKQHNFKQLDQPTICRPTSPTRRNNPHPPGVFLRLHVLKDQGYHSRKPGQNPCKGVSDCQTGKDRSMYYTLKDCKRMQRNGQMPESTQKEVVPSLHRWLKCAGKQEREKMNKLKRNMWIQDTRPKTVDPNRYLLHTYDTVPQVKIYRPYRREFGFRP